MTTIRYVIVLLLCVVFMSLNALEAYLYRSWEKDLDEQRDHQAKATYAQHVDLFTDQLVRRTATDALNDPPLMDMLKKQGIRIVARAAPGSTASAPVPVPGPDVAPPTPEATNPAASTPPATP